jgi:hypothetical protein
MSENGTKTPGERAPLLLIFAGHASRMAALMRERPNLTARLILAPREALHAIGAFLHLAPDAIRPNADVAAIIHDADPRDLLGAALPGCPARLFKALDRAGDRVRERAFYERLGAISHSPFGRALLDGGDLDDNRIGFYETLLKMDPIIASLHGALGEMRHQAEAVDSLLAFLRERHVLHDSDFRLPPKAGMASLARRLQRAMGRIPAPDVGFSPPAPYRAITSTDELQRIGKAFGNCVAMPNYHAAEYHFRLINGTSVFLVSDEPALLVALRRVGGDLWMLEQVAGPKNQAPPKGTQATLLRDLADVGLKFVITDPQAAYARIHHESQRRRALPDGDEDDVEDEQDDGIDVAVEEVAA